jgi:hypothetical protein
VSIYRPLEQAAGRPRLSQPQQRGQVVGSFTDAGDVRPGFLWGKVTTIDPPGVKAVPGSPGTRAIDLKDRGDVVGSYLDGHAFHGFVRNRRGYSDIDSIDPLPGLGTEAGGINNRGEVVGRYALSIDGATASCTASGGGRALPAPRQTLPVTAATRRHPISRAPPNPHPPGLAEARLPDPPRSRPVK